MGNPLPMDDDTLPTDAPLVMPDAEQPGIEPDMVIIPLYVLIGGSCYGVIIIIFCLMLL